MASKDDFTRGAADVSAASGMAGNGIAGGLELDLAE